MMLAWQGEELRAHLLGVAEVAGLLAERLKLGLEREARIAGLLHDLGKADAGAQERIAVAKGAPGHEILSAVVGRELLQSLGLPHESQYAVTVAILRHHYAMRDLGEALKELASWFKGDVADAEELASTLAEGFKAVGLNTTLTIAWPRSPEELEHRLRSMQSAFEKLYSRAAPSLQARLLAGLLTVADTYVASKARADPGAKSLYKAEVNQFLSNILKTRSKS